MKILQCHFFFAIGFYNEADTLESQNYIIQIDIQTNDIQYTDTSITTPNINGLFATFSITTLRITTLS